MLRVAFVGLVGLLVAVPGRASLYQPDDPMPFAITPAGVAEPLPFEEFKRRLIIAMNQVNPLPLTEGQKNTDRDRLVTHIADRKNVPKPSVPDTLALAADLLRVGQPDEALNLLKPRDNPKRPDYFVCTTLAHIHAARQEWRTARDKLSSVTEFDDAEMPAVVKGLTPPQRDWVGKLDRDYVLAYFKVQTQEADAKPRPAPEDEDVYPLFPVAVRNKPHAPVRFVNDRGEYEPGAIAVVQQLVLWFPLDARMYWLLAELYAADGQIEHAQTILNECVNSRYYSGRRALMEHRTAVMTAVEKKLRDEEEARRKALPISLRTIAIYFGVVAVVGVWAGVRAFRRWKRRRG